MKKRLIVTPVTLVQTPHPREIAKWSQRSPQVRTVDSRLMTNRLRTGRFPEQGVDILATCDLWVRRDEMVVQFALAHDGARLTECLSEISLAAQRRIKECVAEIGPFDLVLAAE